jgi:hypothetical protein
MRKILVSVFVAVPVALAFFSGGCSSGADCTAKLCPNDAPPTQAAIDSCNKQNNKCSGSCGSEISCYNSNIKGQVCGTDGKTDITKLAAAAAKCPTSSGCATCLQMP